VGGIVAGVIENTVRTMNERFDCRPENIFAANGPCIGPDAFEVGTEVARHFAEDCRIGYPRPHIDLPSATRRRLITLDIRAENIQQSGECTVAHPDRYFSHRRDGGETGRMAALIGIRAQ